MIERLFRSSPGFVQNILITLYNYKEYRKRMGGSYKAYLKKYIKNNSLSLNELKGIQQEKLISFLSFAEKNSEFYKVLFRESDLSTIQNPEDLSGLPIVNKELLRASINELHTIPKSKGIVSKTGGTTGKSLEVIFTEDDAQDRFAMLDNFRAKLGYSLGKKTAWFSGKNILVDRDIRNKRFWKTDYLHKVRYYSTFHIKEDYLLYYIENLKKFRPQYLVGFPSNMLEIAKYGLKNNLSFPKNMIKAVFPTAETVTEETRNTIERFFNTKIYDQYASSEGAPFIFECINSKLHLELQSGVFEVLDAHNQASKIGRLVLTSFTTHGTPLIRYDIGDSLELSDDVCNCGNNNPLVKQILGRIDDYVFSPENGKINLGNISNTLKGTKGIVKFQVVQDELNKLVILVITDKDHYSNAIEATFIKNWRDRVGEKMAIEIVLVDDISVEASGKYRMVKNNIKHLVT